MDPNDVLAELRSLIEGARSMPMSSSAVINRTQVLELISSVEVALRAASARGDVPATSGNGAAAGSGEQDAILTELRREPDQSVTESEVYRVAKIEAEKVRLAASRDAAELCQQADDYVDTRLATFEITLTRTLEAVVRGRARLQGRSHFDALGQDATESDPDPRSDRGSGSGSRGVGNGRMQVVTSAEVLWPTGPDQGG